MCYNVAFMERKAKEFAERYKRLLPDEPAKETLNQQLPLFYFVSGFDHPKLPIIMQDGMQLSQWGLIPEWVRNGQSALEIRDKTLNAMGETAFEKPSFKTSIQSHRCLVPVSGFYEWRDENKVKYPYYIHPIHDAFFSLGGICNSWTNPETGEKQSTFSIITTPANALMQKIHNVKKRMPLILTPEQELAWIDPTVTESRVQDLMKPYDENEMAAFTVSQKINSVKTNRNQADAMTPVEYPQLTLLDAWF